MAVMPITEISAYKLLLYFLLYPVIWDPIIF